MMLRDAVGSTICNIHQPRKYSLLLLVGVFLMVGVTGGGASERSRVLTFEDRVRAQEAIERVHHSHQIGATKPFEEAVPREVIEAKVLTYLRESVALERCWQMPVTAEMLQTETERMARRSWMPERLEELYSALDNDGYLFRETIARAVLVNRMSRDFFAFDEGLHASARREAEALRERLITGEVTPYDAAPHQSVFDLDTSTSGRDSSSLDRQVKGGIRHSLTPKEFRTLRSKAPAQVGEPGPVEEVREAFLIRVVLEASQEHFRLATFSVAKRTWDDWWHEVADSLDSGSVCALVSADVAWPRSLGSSTRESDARGYASLATSNHPAATAFSNTTHTWDDSSLLDMPGARMLHSAVWTGNLMVLWGGNGYALLNTGRRYDPVTDSWTSTSTVNAPAARVGHTAVWTGTTMVVWGGSNGSSRINTGGRYDPTTDTWTPTSTTNAPVGRIYHTAVWTGNLMIVWGGHNSGYLDTGGRYDPASDTWMPTSTTSAPSGRQGHTAVWTGNLMIVWGGWEGVSAGGRYNPTTDSWSATSAMNAPAGRHLHTAVWTGSSMVVWGGASSSGSATFDTGGRYDPGTDSWAPMSLANAAAARYHHAAVWTGDVMVVWGGVSSLGYLVEGGRYDPAVDSWTPTSTINAPSGRFWHTAVWAASLMVVFGGTPDGGGSALDSGGRYDEFNDTWTATCRMTTYYRDSDGDGYGDSTVFAQACSQPSGYAFTGDDCNDGHPLIYPGAAEVCDGVDEDCDGQIDEDSAGTDADTDGVHNVCDNCRFAYNPTQQDTDNDAVGNACDNCQFEVNPLQADLDLDQRGDVCDNCPAQYNPLQDETDRDGIGDVCDNCPLAANLDQADSDLDLEGDVCDLNDGLIVVRLPDDLTVEWQQEAGFEAFNWYRGDLSVLKGSGVYTQDPNTVPLAGRECGLPASWTYDITDIPAGKAVFYLVTGVHMGVESGLGANSAGSPRPNPNPCP